MDSIIYLRLIGLTAGTLLPLFWMVVILGYRRQRNFERVLFFLFTSLFLFYAAAFHMATHQFPRIGAPGFDFVLPGDTLPNGYPHVFTYSLIWCTTWEFRFWRNTRKGPERQFYGFLTLLFAVAAIWIIGLYDFPINLPVATRQWLGAVLATLPVVPLAVMIYLVWRHNFLQIGRQKNLVYAVSATFLALLYLSLVRRVSGWMEPVLPPEASASILLFVLVPFIEPLQRILGRTLEETAHRELDRVQGLSGEVQQEAKQGDVAALVRFVDRRVAEEFELALARVVLTGIDRERALEGASHSLDGAHVGEMTVANAAGADSLHRFRIGRGDQNDGFLLVQPHGAFLSGETTAALEFLCEQLPNALELCLLIEEKLRLERELAERERLAVLGQMAASISHNLKNPLGSIKTILQVQMENPDLPPSMRAETKMVLDEIGRLSAKLSQLLQFSRPTVRGGSVRATCEVRTIIDEVIGVLNREAERRGISLEAKLPKEELVVAAANDAVSDVVSNLVVNALEAVSRGGRISVGASVADGICAVTVEDDGAGIPPAARE